MDDLELDRELQAALAVAPSPEFVARVRTTIAETPSPSITAGWLKPAAAIGCVALVAIAVGVPRDDARLKRSLAEIASGPVEEMPAAAWLKPSTTTVQPSAADIRAPRARTVVAPTVRSARPIRSARHASASTKEPPLPEVIIATGDVEALRQFVIGAHELRFVASFDETPASIPWVTTELSTSPIVIGALESAPAHNN